MKHHRITALLALLTAGAVQADTFFPITSVTSDTAGTDLFPAVRMIEGPGIGFQAVEPHNRTSGLTWVTNAPNGGGRGLCQSVADAVAAVGV